MASTLFPYFHRGKPAWIFSSLEITFLWAMLIGLVTVNLISVQKSRPAHWNRLMMLFEAPFSVSRHIDLASLLWKQGNTQEARELMVSAQTLTNLSQPDQFDQSSNILGATTNPQAILAQWEYEAQELKEKYAFWQSVASARPDYRDAFISLASLAYQLGYLPDARVWLSRAFTLDPNSSTIQEFSTFLK